MINHYQLAIVTFSALNPVVAWIIFANLTNNLQLGQKIYLCLNCTIGTLFILTIILLTGSWILNKLGIAIYVIQLGGGLLVLLSGIFGLLVSNYQLELRYYAQKVANLFAGNYKITSYQLWLSTLLEQQTNPQINPERDWQVRLIPLTVLINPPVILIMLYLSKQNSNDNFNYLAILAAIIILFSCSLLFAASLIKKLGQVGLVIINQICGLFLTIIALEMLIDGFKGIIHLII